jgi:outer membrane protein assembly factor BamA
MKILSLTAFTLLATSLYAARSQTFTAAKIDFSHPAPYSQAQLESAAGMHAGTKFTAEELGAAAQRLADTGYFSDVGARTAPGRIDAITVQFDVTPLDRSQMLHVTFENFVWLTHQEIEAALRGKSPLFQGYVPANNQLLDAFNDALTAALAKKGITAKVIHDVFEPALGRPEIDIDYWVATPSIRVANVKLDGVSTDLVPLIQKSVNSVAGKPYSAGLAGETTRDRILAPLLNAGYIDAALSDEAATPGASGDAEHVVVSGTLHTGEVYRVSGITFAGTPMFGADAFASTEKLHTGDIAGREQLLETLKPLDAAYRRAGYADVSVAATPQEDAATHQVAYTVTVTPGELYRIKTITPNGLDAAEQADFDKGFTMKAGDIYNPEYLQAFYQKAFLENNTALRKLAEFNFSYKAYADPSTHTVDLVLNFARDGVQQNVTVFGGS